MANYTPDSPPIIEDGVARTIIEYLMIELNRISGEISLTPNYNKSLLNQSGASLLTATTTPQKITTFASVKTFGDPLSTPNASTDDILLHTGSGRNVTINLEFNVAFGCTGATTYYIVPYVNGAINPSSSLFVINTATGDDFHTFTGNLTLLAPGDATLDLYVQVAAGTGAFNINYADMAIRVVSV